MNPEFGTETIEAPIDGWMMAKAPKNPDAAKELLYHFGTAAAQEAYLSKDPSVIGAALDVDTVDLHPAAAEGPRGGLRGADGDAVPRPRHQPGVRLERRRSGVRGLPGRSLEHRLDPRRHAGPGRGHLRGVTPIAPAAHMRRARFTLAAKRGQHWQRQPRSRTRQPSRRSPGRAEGPPSPAVRRTRPLDRAGDGGDPDDPARRAGLDPDDRLDLALVHGLERDPAQRHQLGRASRTTSRSSRSSQKNFFQALINNSVLLIFLFIGPTALGICLAYLLDRDIRGTRFYQGIFFTPVVLSLAVVGFMWQSVIYSTENGLATQLFGGGNSVDWIGNQSFVDSHSATTSASPRTFWRSWWRSPGDTPATSWCSTSLD